MVADDLPAAVGDDTPLLGAEFKTRGDAQDAALTERVAAESTDPMDRPSLAELDADVSEPVPTDELARHAARFAALPAPPGVGDAAPRSAALDVSPWREDVLDADSPVPPLEFHLARHLRDAAGAGRRPSDEDPP